VSGDAVIVEREAVRVLFKRTTDEQEAITRAWAELEAVVGSLKGRKFFGTFDPATQAYCVCVQRQDDDDAGALGLEDGTIPGGRYVPRAPRGRAAGGLRPDPADVRPPWRAPRRGSGAAVDRVLPPP
jgi:hypothetical protein